jgi:AraC-like DNA-binding protein
VPRYSALVYGSALETRTAHTHYSWHGLQRDGDALHPYVVFQYTLSGWGCYQAEDTLYTVTPQMAFTAYVPSNHRYYLPPASPHWTFFWLIIRHPYIVSRIAGQIREAGPLLASSSDSLLMLRALELLEHLYHPAPYDSFAEEETLFRFLIEYERTIFNRRYPQAERERLLHYVSTYVRHALPQPVEVEALAMQYQMSRSAFSHHFKTITGLSPAQFMTRIRLEEAVSQLLQTPQRLEDIALATGFASATHFCKVFRRHYQMSPGMFRQQMKHS